MTSADYRVVVIQSTGKKEAILDIARLEYGDIINQIRTFSLTIGKSNEDDYSKFNAYEVVSGTETGIIYIYRQGTLDFAGIIENPTYDKFGRLVLTGIGMEVKIGWKGTGTDKTYSNSALSTIVTNMIGDISGIDVSEANNEDSAGGNLTKPDVSGMSYLDGLKHAIVDLGDNEWYMTYSDSGNSDFNNVQYRGSNTSIGKLVEGIDISRVQRTKNTQRIFNKVIALGKSEGETKITVTREANQVTGHSGYDMAKYGTREPSKPLVNRRIQNTTDLTKFADNFLTQHMYPVEIITFDVDDIDFSHNVGDLVTIRSKARLKDTGDVNTADMRIISQKRIITPESERLILGVTKEGLNTLPTDISTRMNRIEDQMLSQQTTVQGNLETLTYTHAGKANSTNKAEMEFTLPSWITNSAQIKEAKLTVKRLPLYYDIGTATESGTANLSSGNHLHNDGTYSTDSHGHADGSYTVGNHLHGDGSYSAGNHTHGDGSFSAEAHGSGDSGYQFGPYTHSPTGNNTWQSVGNSINIGSYTYLFHGIFLTFNLEFFSLGTGTAYWTNYIYVRAKNTTDNTYYPSSSGVLISTAHSITLDHYYNSIIPFYLHIPMNWTSKTYRLQYKCSNETNWQINIKTLRYAYHGSRGHTHGVSGSSGSTTPGVNGSSGSTTPGFSGNSGNTSSGVGGDSGNTNPNIIDSGHTNTITQGINTVSESSLTFTYDTNGNTGNVGSLAVGAFSSELDVKSKINNPSSSRNNYIKLYPTSGNAITVYTLTIKAYRET